MWIIPFCDCISIVLLLTFKHFRFLSVLRTVYTHVAKTFSGFAKIIRVSSVNLKTVFTCYRKQKILVHYGKGYKAARRYSSDLNCFAHFLRTGFRQTSFETALLSLYWQLLRSLVLKSLAHSKTATLTRKLLRWRFFTLRVYFVLCKRSVVRSVP